MSNSLLCFQAALQKTGTLIACDVALMAVLLEILIAHAEGHVVPAR